MAPMIPQARHVTNARISRKAPESGYTKTSTQDFVSLRVTREEEVDTDVGSSGSDAESVGSSASASDHSEGSQNSLSNCGRQRTLRGNTSLPRPRPRVPPRGRFNGTPLSPIPGTPAGSPVAAGDQDTSRFSFALPSLGFESTADAQVKLVAALEAASPVQSLQAAPPPMTPSVAPQAPKPRAALTILAYDSSGSPLVGVDPAMPQKIELPTYFVMPLRSLDPRLPAKKRPPFPGDVPATFHHLCVSEPVKKRLTKFLLADSPCISFGLSGRLEGAPR